MTHRGPGLWDEVCSPKMQWWSLLALADLFVINRPPTHRGPFHALMGSRLSLRCVMREIHRKVMRINLPTTKHSTSEIVLLVSVFPPPIEYPVRGDA